MPASMLEPPVEGILAILEARFLAEDTPQRRRRDAVGHGAALVDVRAGPVALDVRRRRALGACLAVGLCGGAAKCACHARLMHAVEVLREQVFAVERGARLRADVAAEGVEVHVLDGHVALPFVLGLERRCAAIRSQRAWKGLVVRAR